MSPRSDLLPVSDGPMVFGRKSAPVKPQPPGVEDILEDLAKAPVDDPLFALVPSLARDVVEEDEDTAENRNYKQVADYLAKEEKLSKLQARVGQEFDALVSSQKELAKVTGEVQQQVAALKEARGRIKVPAKVEQVEQEDSESELC